MKAQSQHADRIVSFISIGPTCVGAELLKAGGFRKCTYGFDWARSGYIHFKDFLSYSVDRFVDKHVVNPHIALVQKKPPTNENSMTGHIGTIEPLYGYPYFYNPHRDLEEPETIEYHRRCLTRLKEVTLNDSVHKYFVIADYRNKPNSIFINDENMALYQLKKLLIDSKVNNYTIIMVRISLLHEPDSPVTLYKETKDDAILVNIGIDCMLDAEEVRRYTYAVVSKAIFSELVLGSHIWRPNS